MDVHCRGDTIFYIQAEKSMLKRSRDHRVKYMIQNRGRLKFPYPDKVTDFSISEYETGNITGSFTQWGYKGMGGIETENYWLQEKELKTKVDILNFG